MNNTEAINKEIYEEALRWVHGNKGTTINPNAASYPSPRISSELPDCSMPLTFDSYNFCSLGCSYCFAYIFKLNNPSLSTKEIQLKSINVNHLIDVMSGKFKSDYDQAFYEYFYKNKFLFHWGGLADPFCNFELANGVGYKLMNFLGDMNYPTLFSFKGATIFQKKYSDLFAKFSDQANFAFQVSMVTADDNMAKTVEVGVPLPQKRFAALKMLSDMGYWTILRLRPFIIGVTDCSLDELLNKALASGINAVSMEFYAMDVRAPVAMRARYEWLAKAIGVSGGADGLMSYFKHLSPSERGSYLRLNRLVKEIYVKKIYKFCLDNNLIFACSDPDFKELNMSGSCCGMPDKFPKNSLLENWSKSQLTYHIKEARLKYYRTNKKQYLYFNEVYGQEKYFDDKKISNDHVSVIGMCNATRQNLTFRNILQRQWNNLRSPANPRNYFHGKLMPNGVDGTGNLIYIYNPMEYEQRWIDEGIRLDIK